MMEISMLQRKEASMGQVVTGGCCETKIGISVKLLFHRSAPMVGISASRTWTWMAGWILLSQARHHWGYPRMEFTEEAPEAVSFSSSSPCPTAALQSFLE